MHSAGDVNGDGLDDLIIGAVDADPVSGTKAGAAYVLFGTTTAITSPLSIDVLDGTNGFILDGGGADDKIGQSVSSAGDINGDGYDDILVGAQGYDVISNQNEGAAFVVFGSDFNNSVDFEGTSGDDTLTGNSGNNFLIGGLGNDVLDGGAGDDVLLGANGDDTLVFDANDVTRVDGGQGFDTLQVGGSGSSLDLTTVNQTEFYSLYRNFEAIDLVAGSGSDSLSLGKLDLLNIAGSVVPSGFTGPTLAVDGDASDTLTITDPASDWTDNGTVTNTFGNGQTYRHLSSDNANLLVDTDINIAPTVTDDSVRTNSLTFSVAKNVLSSNDIDFDGDTLGISALSGQTGLTAAINGSNIDVTVGAEDSSGSFVYTTTDGNGGSNTATVTVFHSTADTLTGSTGNDVLIGSTGGDTILGNAGNDILIGGSGSDVFSFQAAADVVTVSTDTTVTTGTNQHNLITDFTTGADNITLGSAFSFSAALSGANFFTIGSQFDGTNSGMTSSSTPYLVVDSTNTVYFDTDSSTAGFQVIAETQGDTPAIGDFTVEVIGGGGGF